MLSPLLVTVATASEGGGTVTTLGLIRQMTDLRELAEYPEPFFTCQQFSSYDRKSVAPDQEWFANGDRGHYLRIEEIQGRQ